LDESLTVLGSTHERKGGVLYEFVLGKEVSILEDGTFENDFLLVDRDVGQRVD